MVDDWKKGDDDYCTYDDDDDDGVVVGFGWECDLNQRVGIGW